MGNDFQDYKFKGFEGNINSMGGNLGGLIVHNETELNDKDIRKLKSWAVKLPENVIGEIEKLYEASGLRYKNEFVEHLINTHKVNLLKEGKLVEELIHPDVAKRMSGDLFELAKLTQMINELFVQQLEKFSQEQYEFERLKKENENLKNQLKQKTGTKGSIASEYLSKSIAPDMAHGHMLFVGTSGTGKSYATKMEIKKAIEEGKQVIVIDVQGEYNHITRQFGGQVVKLSDSSATRLNPLDLYLDSNSYSDALVQKILFVSSFIENLLNRSFSATERKTILGSIEDTYKKFGIDRSTKTTEGLKVPTLSDLSLELRRHEIGIDIAEELDPYVNGVFSMFNGTKNITLYKSPIIVFDIHDMDRNLSNSSYMLCLEYIISLVKNNELGSTLIVLDEIFPMFAHHVSKDFLLSSLKASRRANIQYLLVTQDTKGLFEHCGEAILTTIHMVNYFKQSPNDCQFLLNEGLIDETESNILRNARRSEAFIHIRSYNPIKFFFQYPSDEDITQPYEDLLK